MKKNNKHQDAPTQRVRLEMQLEAEPAKQVCLAGTFNDWAPAVTPMLALGDGKWAKELSLPPGTYEYLFVVDGQWRPDPHARACVPNPYGGVNAVLEVRTADGAK